MIRLEAGLIVVRFCELAGIPQSTWYRRRAQALSGDRPVKGPWPAPKRRELEAVVHFLALRYPAWGHRKISRADGRPRLRGERQHRVPDHVRARAGAPGPLSG
jgi:hypothetical protein